MTCAAIDIESIEISEAVFDHEQNCEIVAYDFRERESLSANFNDEIEAWARHSLALNGFGDY